MKKLILSTCMSVLAIWSFANPATKTKEKVSRPIAGTTVIAMYLPIAVATYTSKCGEVWDFVIPYKSLRQLPGYLTQMMNDADDACGKNISYIQY